MKHAMIAAAIMLTSPAWAGENPFPNGRGFDWDRYHERQGACAEKDRIVEACARGYCDELSLRQATRECSAFGPLGDRR